MHFCTLVILPMGSESYRAASIAASLMEPYVENADNPKGSHWDWYQIGGRFTGLLTGYEPEKDPKNMEPCRRCHGSGKFAGIDCAQCEGKAKALKWPTEWEQYAGDILPVDEIVPGFMPYAVITPEGTWHDETTMAWFGMACNEGEADWKRAVASAFKAYRKNLAVVVDCHI